MSNLLRVPLGCLLVTLAGCGATHARPPLEQTIATVTVNGSGALMPLLLEASTQFMRANKDVVVLVLPSSGRESAAVRDVVGGDLSLAATNLPVSGNVAVLDVREICDVPLAFFANRGTFDEGVHSLTRAQLRGVLVGTINNWSALGGEDQRIIFVDRRDSGDHVALARWLGLADFAPPTSEESFDAILQSVLVTRLGALSFMALPYRHPELQMLSIDGVEPSVATMRNGSYPLRMRERIALRKDAPAMVRRFADFLESPTVQDELLEQLGYAPIAKPTDAAH